MRFNVVFLFLIIYGFPAALHCQHNNIEDKISSSLALAGFENIRINIEDKIVYAALEDRVHRLTAEGIPAALDIIEKAVTDKNKILLILLNNDLPAITAEVDLISAKTQIRYFYDEEWNRLNKTQKYNSSSLRSDLILSPETKFQFGDYSDPVKAQINLIPEVRTMLMPGMSSSLQLIVPVINDFSAEGDYVRPGNLALNQQLHLSGLSYTSLTVGYFTENRYGIDLEYLNLFHSSDFSIGARIGYTGFLQIFDDKLIYSKLYYWTALANIEYRITEYDLTFNVTAGQYLFDDKSVRVDVNRQFGEVEIGFFINKSFNNESNAGINFSVPIFPSEYNDPGIIRIRPAKNYSYEYRVKGKIFNLSGHIFNTGFSLKDDFKRLNPGFISNYLSR